ncbi:hypothetical protein GDO81_009594 [Engystomops pustulosus]|uniref:Uncharacterized protein n=1 Tax=Engystomops pustulosus TaxID=76066 RepID=A0AAV7BSY8_ENGPU|nr:hypothetical protein GDO81_009594 [Engystomops pustulosus]
MLARVYRTVTAPRRAAAVRGRVHTMPRKESKEGKGQKKGLAQPAHPTGPVVLDKSGCVLISVHAKPGSKLNAITGWKKSGENSEDLSCYHTRNCFRKTKE